MRRVRGNGPAHSAVQVSCSHLREQHRRWLALTYDFAGNCAASIQHPGCPAAWLAAGHPGRGSPLLMRVQRARTSLHRSLWGTTLAAHTTAVCGDPDCTAAMLRVQCAALWAFLSHAQAAFALLVCTRLT